MLTDGWFVVGFVSLGGTRLVVGEFHSLQYNLMLSMIPTCGEVLEE